MPGHAVTRFEAASLLAAIYGIFFGVWWQFFNELIFTLKQNEVRGGLSPAIVKAFMLGSTTIWVCAFVFVFTTWIIKASQLSVRQDYSWSRDILLCTVAHLFVANLLIQNLEARSAFGVALLVMWFINTIALLRTGD